MKTQPEGLIILQEGTRKKTDLDTFLKGGEIVIPTDDLFDASEKISEIIKGAQKHGNVLVAFGGGKIGPILSFIANKNDVNGIFTCFGEEIVRLPPLKLDISETRLKIISLLVKKDANAVEIGQKIGISRAMVYKHLNGLIDLGLVKKSPHMEKYAITKAGRLVIN
jgi:DNA-binding transcriptional ArsR family regulator